MCTVADSDRSTGDRHRTTGCREYQKQDSANSDGHGAACLIFNKLLRCSRMSQDRLARERRGFRGSVRATDGKLAETTHCCFFSTTPALAPVRPPNSRLLTWN